MDKLGDKEFQELIVSVSKEITKLETTVLPLLDKIAANLDEIDKILSENQLIRARNIASYDKDVRDSVSNLIQDDSLDKVYLLVDEINQLWDKLDNIDISEE